MNWKARFKGEYIQAAEFGDKKPTLTITKIDSKKLEQEDGSTKSKAIMWFKETERGFVYSKTVGHCIAAMFGDDEDAWLGKRVTLHAEMVQVGKEKEPGIRVTGSPDIDRPLKVSIKLPQKKAFIVSLVPTGGQPVEAMPQQTEETAQ